MLIAQEPIVSGVQDSREEEQGPQRSTDAQLEQIRKLLPELIKVDMARAVLKVTVYFGVSAALVALIVTQQSMLVTVLAQMALGLLWAHGLELQHECLHQAMFPSRTANRLLGFLFGAPMLVSYSHYHYQHLHHHKHVGTSEDAEIFNYERSSLNNPIAFFIRAWNLSRIPAFLLTLLGFLQGSYPPVFSAPHKRREVLVEYLALALLLGGGLYAILSGAAPILVKVWLIPWLAFGEFFHFMIELPEHLGCDKSKKDVFINTRSYKTNPVIAYLVNGNNYHVEHHLFPRVAIHKLAQVHELLKPRIQHLGKSYPDALRQVFTLPPR
jgi:fatty acid desaturase